MDPDGVSAAPRAPPGERDATLGRMAKSHRPEPGYSVLAAFGILPAFMVVSMITGLVLVVWGTVTGSVRPDDADGIQAWLEELIVTAPGLIVMTLPGQAFLIAVAFLWARVSKFPWRERLSLRSPGLGPLSWALIVGGSFGMLLTVQLVSEHLIQEPSEQLQMIAKVLTETRGATAVLVAVLFSLVPGFSEELFFRGLVQTGLARWPAWVAIGLSAFTFALLHMDPQHSTLVLPLGVWFAFVAWATRSVVTSMVVHALNNLTAIVLGQRFGDAKWSELAPPAMLYSVAGVLLLVAAACVVHLVRRRGPDPEPEPLPEPEAPPAVAPPVARAQEETRRKDTGPSWTSSEASPRPPSADPPSPG